MNSHTGEVSQNNEMHIKMSFQRGNLLRKIYLIFFSIFPWLESDHVGIEIYSTKYICCTDRNMLESDHVGIEIHFPQVLEEYNHPR